MVPALVLILSASWVLAGCGGGQSERDPALSGPLYYYIAAQEALAGDDFASAQKALQALAGQVEETLKVQVDTAAGAGDIKSMRTAFKPLSEEFAVLEIPAGYALAYCPMADDDKGARWIQKKGEIANPYFGASMLHCGVFEEAKEP